MKGLLVSEIASKTPIVIYPTTSVKQACAVMVDNGIRRVPVVNSGTKKVEGILSARDVIDFFGGGQKYNIIRNEFKGNLFAAVNLPVSKIMGEKVCSVKENDTVYDSARKMLECGVGGCPVVDKNGVIKGVVSERDFIKKVGPELAGSLKISKIMNRGVISVSPETSLKEASKIMISKSYRRLPVMQHGDLVGILRTTGMLKFISSGEFANFGTASADAVLSEEKVEDAMSDYFVTVSPDDDIASLVELMLARRLGGFPVEENGKVIGIVTEHDVFKFAYSKR